MVPTGFVFIVRDIDLLCVSEAIGDAAALIAPTLQGITYWRVTTAGFPVMFSWRGRQVYSEGEKVGFEVFQGSFNIMCSGYRLTLP